MPAWLEAGQPRWSMPMIAPPPPGHSHSAKPSHGRFDCSSFRIQSNMSCFCVRPQRSLAVVRSRTEKATTVAASVSVVHRLMLPANRRFHLIFSVRDCSTNSPKSSAHLIDWVTWCTAFRNWSSQVSFTLKRTRPKSKQVRVNRMTKPAAASSSASAMASLWVLTNRHVILGASPREILLRASNGREFYPTKVISDASTDVAVMKIDELELPPARLGDSNTC